MLKADEFVAGNYCTVLPVPALSAEGRRLGSVDQQPLRTWCVLWSLVSIRGAEEEEEEEEAADRDQ